MDGSIKWVFLCQLYRLCECECVFVVERERENKKEEGMREL